MHPPGRRLREAWEKGIVAMPGVFCPVVGRMAERLGFEAGYLSGAALSATKALPDIGLVSVTEFETAIREICAATSLPILCDADTGFGEPLNVERTVRLFESAGAAGFHLEDQQFPKRCGHLSGKTLVSTSEMCSKIQAAAGARRDASFVILARTDARGVVDLDEAVSRAVKYLEAGADGIFPEALQDEAEFREFARKLNEACPNRAPIPLLANMTEFGKSPLLSRTTLEDAGYRIALYPVSTLRSALHAVERLLSTILDHGTQQAEVSQMLDRARLYDLIDYTQYEERDRDYFS